MKAFVERIDFEYPYSPKEDVAFVKIHITIPVVSRKALEKLKFFFLQKLPIKISIGLWKEK